jgi:hypothetical protein
VRLSEDRDIEIEIEDGGDRLTLTLTERSVGQGEGDTRLRVYAQCLGSEGNAFTGNVGVWIDRSDAETFISALAALELSRRGSATLKSMSPDELLLEIAVVDSVGHVAARGHLRRHAPGHRGGQIDFNLSVYPDSLPRLLRQARGLLLVPG